MYDNWIWWDSENMHADSVLAFFDFSSENIECVDYSNSCEMKVRYHLSWVLDKMAI